MAAADAAASTAKSEAATAIGALEILYDLAEGDKGLAAIESVGAKAALGIAVVAATGASAVSREAALASKQAVLDAAQSLASDNLIGSAPTDASEAYACH